MELDAECARGSDGREGDQGSVLGSGQNETRVNYDTQVYRGDSGDTATTATGAVGRAAERNVEERA